MSESKNFVSIVLLNNFDSDMDCIQLNDNLFVRRLDETDRKRLMNLSPVLKNDYRLQTVLSETWFVIEKRWQPDEFLSWDECSPYANDVVLALKLLKSGGVNAPTAFLLDSTNKSFGVSNPAPRIDLGESYFLEEQEVSTFVELWKKLRSVKKEKPHLEFPLDQFTKAFEEEHTEYIIVDFMTAFESLVFYGRDKTPRPIGRAIGIEMGKLLGKNKEGRSEIEQDLETAYQLRNAVVHGHLRKRLQKYDAEQGTELIFKVEDYLRFALRKLLEE